MCTIQNINCDIVINALATLVAAWAGAKCAFNYNKKLEKDKARKEELNCIFSYYGYLINLYRGYNATANSLISIPKGYRIENNLSKIQNIKCDFGCLNFIMHNSNKLFENIFALEKDIDILVEKSKLYSVSARNGDPDLSAKVITLRQFVEVYAEIIAMIYSFDSYAQAYYDHALTTTKMKKELDEAKSSISQVVTVITDIKCSLKDNDNFSKKMKDKEKWYLRFSKHSKLSKIIKIILNFFGIHSEVKLT